MRCQVDVISDDMMEIIVTGQVLKRTPTRLLGSHLGGFKQPGGGGFATRHAYHELAPCFIPQQVVHSMQHAAAVASQGLDGGGGGGGGGAADGGGGSGGGGGGGDGESPSTVGDSPGSSPGTVLRRPSLIAGGAVAAAREQHGFLPFGGGGGRSRKPRAEAELEVQLTPMSRVPGTDAVRYLGRINLHFIKESTASGLREGGGIGTFFQLFLSECSTMCRAHVKAMGGNYMLNYRFVPQQSGMGVGKSGRNQVYHMISIAGDAVFVQ